MERLTHDRRAQAAVLTAPGSALETNKVLKNTYLLLAATRWRFLRSRRVRRWPSTCPIPA